MNEFTRMWVAPPAVSGTVCPILGYTVHDLSGTLTLKQYLEEVQKL